MSGKRILLFKANRPFHLWREIHSWEVLIAAWAQFSHDSFWREGRVMTGMTTDDNPFLGGTNSGELVLKASVGMSLRTPHWLAWSPSSWKAWHASYVFFGLRGLYKEVPTGCEHWEKVKQIGKEGYAKRQGGRRCHPRVFVFLFNILCSLPEILGFTLERKF